MNNKVGNQTVRTALVAGGAGFIGSHLCERLISEGWRVVCVDNLQTGSLSNLRNLLDNPMFSFIEHDVVQEFDSGYDGINLIFNLACPASPVQYQKDPVSTTMTSVLGTRNLLELARSCECVLVHASTSEVYGDPEIHPQPESYNGNVSPIGVRSCYDEGKRCAESLCSDYLRSYGTDARIVRIFNTYGPRMAADDGRVVSNFIVQALRNDDITVYGDGSQTRSFMYIDDLVDAMLRVSSLEGPLTFPINIGNPEEITVAELSRRIICLTGSSSRIIHEPLPQDDPKRRCPDMGFSAGILKGWRPLYSLDEGLARTIEHFKSTICS